jgi:hypothetical protein
LARKGQFCLPRSQVNASTDRLKLLDALEQGFSAVLAQSRPRALDFEATLAHPMVTGTRWRREELFLRDASGARYCAVA